MRSVLAILLVLFATYSVLVYEYGHGDRDERASTAVRVGIRIRQEEICQSCHQLYGLGGYMGPDLTNVVSQRDTMRIRTFIRYGTGRMPAHALSDEEIDQLIAFLAWVDRTGTRQMPPEATHWTGTYLLEKP
ncbi:MAG: cytochrome c [Flavobacteriales bacterium]|nr:cytochrome c [Flavobacteriales bacterium]